MSLINQMLKDLSNRERGVDLSSVSDNTHGQAVLYRLTQLSFPNQSMKIKSIFLLLGFSVSIAMFSYYRHVPLLKMMPPLQASIQAKQNVHDAGMIVPVLSMMQEAVVSEMGDQVDIRIPFDKVPLYRLDAYPELKRISIYFDHTRIPDNFQPRIHPEGGLTGMNYLQMGEDARIDLDISDELQLKNIIQLGQVIEIQFHKQNSLNMTANSLNQSKQAFKQLTPIGLLQAKYDEAIDKAQAGDQISAQQDLFSIVESSPGYLPARVALIALTLSLNQESVAKRFIARGLEISPHAADLLSLKANILLRHQQTDEAIRLLTQESPSFEKYPEYYAQLASAYLQKSDYGNALKIYQALNQRLSFVKPEWREGFQIALQNVEKSSAASEEVSA